MDMKDKRRDEEQVQPEETPVQEVEQAAEEPVAQEASPSPEAAAKALADEYLLLAQRVQADFDNFRRRNESVRADSFSEGQRNVATAMLPVLDNLERALASSSEDSPLRSGVELTLRQLSDTFAKLGITAISRQGEKFDPNLENAVMQGTAEEGEPGTVCLVLQKGYMMGDRVLRHAMVKVVAE